MDQEVNVSGDGFEIVAVGGAGANYLPVMSVEAAIQRLEDVRRFMDHALEEGVDYAVPEWAKGKDVKPSLLKSGAEKLCFFFGLSVENEPVDSVLDWTGADHDGEAFFHFTYRCTARRGGVIIATADGSANSWEKKYRYRQGDRVCPRCKKETIYKSHDGDEGWYCWAKQGGCGARFAVDHDEIVDQVVGQKRNPDVPDLVNTFQKMAQKRSLVGVTLIATGASAWLGQDLDEETDEAKAAGARRREERATERASARASTDAREILTPCPKCGEVASVMVSKFGPGNTLYCNHKKGGCGQTFERPKPEDPADDGEAMPIAASTKGAEN